MVGQPVGRGPLVALEIMDILKEHQNPGRGRDLTPNLRIGTFQTGLVSSPQHLIGTCRAQYCLFCPLPPAPQSLPLRDLSRYCERGGAGIPPHPKVSATDPDCGVNAMVNYTLGDSFAKSRHFEVRSGTGEVCISGELDFETREVAIPLKCSTMPPYMRS
uniref:Cadherin domain-containing protein n=1 Tax=Timema cristinae TaxID=61476 RepID=A0A7R9GQB4_TIMCR|nr:unnamed protein product [Timema cristinae]